MNFYLRRATRVRVTHTLALMFGLLVATAPQATAADERVQNARSGGEGLVAPEFAQVVRPGLSVRGKARDRHSVNGDGVRFTGIVGGWTGGDATVRVTLQVRRAGARGWQKAAALRIRSGRKFRIVWHGRTPGRFETRIVARQNGRRAVDRLLPVYVYRRSFASWYGPGFYGRRTACGGTLTGSVMGVAHKSLPCGTKVTFHLHGRTVTARVIDRGPYVHGREWDLTPALKRRLGFGSTGSVNVTR